MILVVDTNLKEVKFWVLRENDMDASVQTFTRDAEDIRGSVTLKRDICNAAGRGRIKAIAFRVLFGGDFFDKPTFINQYFFAQFSKLTDFFPFYIPFMVSVMRKFHDEFAEIPQVAFFETAFFSKLPEEEKYYAIPYALHENNKIKKWGFHGIFHEANCGMFSESEKSISVVFDKQTTVCAAKDHKPFSVSLGFTPLEGVMSRTSCGDLDPGIVFYLMNVHKFSIYKIDDILKNESGFLGLTGYDLEFKDLVKLYGKDQKVNLAFDVYQSQLLKYIGEGISILGGVDNIVFAGSEIETMMPVIYSLIKKISFIGISTKSLPWGDKNEISQVSAKGSQVKVYLNRMGLAKVIFYETENFLNK
jgi:acetate kinase